MRSQPPGRLRYPSGPLRRRFPRILACAFGLLLANAGVADVRQFRFRHVGGVHGLTQNTVSALLQDNVGFVWVGTQGGLHRYDGRDFKVFVRAPDDPDSLPDNFVTALAQGTPGTLWVGTNNAYVAALDLASGHFRRLLPKDLDRPGEPGKRVLALHFDPEHGLWVATEGGVDLLDPQSGQRRSVLRLPVAAAARTTFAFASDRSGILWAVLPSGLYRIDPVTLGTRKIPAPPELASIVADHAGRLWVTADGLYRLDPGTAALTRVDLGASVQGLGDLQRIVVDTSDRLWMGAPRAGLLRFDPRDGKTLVVGTDATPYATLPVGNVDSLLVDRAGLLWVGTFTDGLVTTDPDGARFARIIDPALAASQRTAASVRSLFQAEDGALWIGSDSDGIKRYDFAADRFTAFTHALRAAAPAALADANFEVWVIRSAGHGTLWVGTNFGLYALDPALGTARRVTLGAVDSDPASGRPVGVRALAGDGAGGWWVGTQGHGLQHLDAQGKPLPQPQSISGELAAATITCLYRDPHGGLWIGSMDGMARIDPHGALTRYRNDPRDASTLSGDRIRAIVAGKDGSLWIGSHSGLDRLRISLKRGPIITRYPIRDAEGHPDTIYGIVEDAGGRLWLSSNGGVLRFDPRSGTSRRFTTNDGLQDMEFNGGAYTHLADGRIALGGIHGLNVFDPATISGDSYAPPVVLTSAVVGAGSDDRAGLVAPTRLSLNSSDAVLRLGYAALDFADPANVAYRFKLDGFDAGWVDAGARREATYTNLAPGKYVFQVQATNHDGRWSNQQLRVPVTVIAAWWESTPAKLGYLLLAALGLSLAWRLVQRRHARELAYAKDIEGREQKLQMALWGSGDDYWDLDLTTTLLRRSSARGRNHIDALDATPMAQWRTQVLHPDDAALVEERLDAHLRGETEHFESQHRVRHPRDGQWRTILARGKIVERDAHGKPLRVAGTARDVSRKQAEQRENAIAGEVLGNMSEAVGVVDLTFRFVSVNRAFALMTGYAAEEVVGRDAGVLDSSQHPPEFYQDMRQTLALTGRWTGEMWQRRKDGEEFLCAIEAAEVPEPDGRRGHYVVVVNDITEIKRAEQELRYLANFDTLTGLPNRTLLSERLARAIVRARRRDGMVAVLFLDLDRFKEINDSLGHTAGDRILKAVAARLQATTNPTDTVSRLGGDEFTVVVEDIATPEDAYAAARTILAAFAKPLVVDERSEVTITPSIGISLYPAHGLAPTDLLKHADTAMYQAKAIGRNTFLAYTESMEVQARQRANITAALRRALDRDEFQLLYQPRLSLARGRISGCEALIRWHSEELGEMMPGDFIPIAEETGMIVRIGEWALREACKTLASWQEQGLNDVRIAVNVSVLQLLRGNLPQLIAQILAESGAQPSRLELELTETMIMANAAETRAMFDQLRDMGCSLAIDDFGTGYSSLVYLKQLPIDMLKIDKEFVSEVTTDPDDEAITTTIITMAHSLGLTVIAEGVETQDQLDFLREHACDEIQGFWLSQPLSGPHCATFIHSWHQTTPRTVSGNALASTD
ncbi:MAG: EAL domain-containing protein [Proteobacteria bacterium]|nr:EAL domain-containing protein [Pseudomonadota bacterium]